MMDQNKTTLTGSILKGKIVGFDQHGVIVVEPDEGGTAVPCYCIRNSRAPLPVYEVKDLVAFSVAEDGAEGYIHGLIEPYITCTDEQQHAEPAENEFIQIDRRNRCVSLRGKTIAFESEDEVTIVCGKSTIRLQKDGRVAIRGTRLLSRSSGTNKIKGASVTLN